MSLQKHSCLAGCSIGLHCSNVAQSGQAHPFLPKSQLVCCSRATCSLNAHQTCQESSWCDAAGALAAHSAP